MSKVQDLKDFLEEKNIDKEQIYIFGILFLLILFIAIWFISGSGNTEIDTNAQIEMPEGQEVDEFGGKMDAYNPFAEKEKDSINIDFEKSGLFGSDSINGKPTKRLALEMQIDSLMSATKLTAKNESNAEPKPYVQRKRKLAVSKSTTPEPTSTIPEYTQDDVDNDMEEARIRMEGFFQAEPISSNSNNSTSNIGTSDPFILATIRDNHTIINGDRITMMLSKDTKVNGRSYARNTLLYGITKFRQNRVDVQITKINHNPVNLTVYDAQDGLLGIYVEGENLLGESTREAANEAIDDIDASGIPAGNVIKQVFKKRSKKAKVNLLNDYRLIIKPTK